MKLEKSIAEHHQQAQFLGNQANVLKNIAKATAETAVKQQAAVKLEDAQKSMMLAHHMMAQALVYDQRAFNVNEKAKALQINVAAYEGASQMAAAKASNYYAPEAVPAPPVPVAAFVPGPPPTNINPGSPPELWPMAK